MSIYATLWTLRFPSEGDDFFGCDWVDVRAQGVPAFIGTPTPGQGYEDGDPFASFLPPPIETDEEGDAPFMRAVVIVKVGTTKGKSGHPQEYDSPLLVMSGEDYANASFEHLHGLICDALRGARAPVVMQIFRSCGEGGDLVRGTPKDSD